MSDSPEKQAQSAAEQNDAELDLRDRIYQITLSALSARKLESEHIRQVVHQVSHGLINGFKTHKEQIDDSLKQAVAGIDDAVGESAIATKLAIEEFLAKSGKTADEEVKKVLKEMDALEELFLASLIAAADRSSFKSAQALRDLAAHLKHHGTQTGKKTKEVVTAVRKISSEQAKQNLDAFSKTSDKLKTSIADIASGVLAGMADAIRKRK